MVALAPMEAKTDSHQETYFTRTRQGDSASLGAKESRVLVAFKTVSFEFRHHVGLAPQSGTLEFAR